MDPARRMSSKNTGAFGINLAPVRRAMRCKDLTQREEGLGQGLCWQHFTAKRLGRIGFDVLLPEEIPIGRKFDDCICSQMDQGSDYVGRNAHAEAPYPRPTLNSLVTQPSAPIYTDGLCMDPSGTHPRAGFRAAQVDREG